MIWKLQWFIFTWSIRSWLVFRTWQFHVDDGHPDTHLVRVWVSMTKWWKGPQCFSCSTAALCHSDQYKIWRSLQEKGKFWWFNVLPLTCNSLSHFTSLCDLLRPSAPWSAGPSLTKPRTSPALTGRKPEGMDQMMNDYMKGLQTCCW